jgi:hypothetical protein
MAPAYQGQDARIFSEENPEWDDPRWRKKDEVATNTFDMELLRTVYFFVNFPQAPNLGEGIWAARILPLSRS